MFFTMHDRQKIVLFRLYIIFINCIANMKNMPATFMLSTLYVVGKYKSCHFGFSSNEFNL